MKKLLSLRLLLTLGMSCVTFASAEDMLVGAAQDEISAQWGDGYSSCCHAGQVSRAT